ncbi:DUF4358 domain-containing protein [Ruminococcaceae bacterium OttesenSCG-928-L11]|nr:DUF4358 domain-containing protein [Ruminococcaceae bacterium OttesenSCG-928-L11]
MRTTDKRMRRALGGLTALVLLITALVGCSGRDSGGAAAATQSAATAADSILQAVTFRDALVEADSATVENFYAIDDTIGEYKVYYSGNGSTAEEIAVLKVSDKKNAADAKAILEKRVADQKERYEQYIPGEMVKLKNPVLYTKDDLVILVLADDKQQAEDAAKAAADGK